MDFLNNFIEDLKEKLRKFSFIIAPLLALILFIIFYKFRIINLVVDSNLQNNIVNVSGILSGFLFTAYGVFISLPDNKFISSLKRIGYFSLVYKILLFGIIFLITAMLMGMFKISDFYMILLFLLGISEVILSVYYFYMITTLSSKSN